CHYRWQKICVVKKEPSLTKDELLAHCKKHLTRYEILKIIEFHN
ncbi:long chain fatty acid CoA-ligase domain protein, partial [Candidatus Erwinia dacicola]